MMKRKIAPTISLLLAACIILSGCSITNVLLPNVKDIVGANLYLSTEPINLTIDLRLMSTSGIVMYYNSSVIAAHDTAIWDGVAKVYFGEMYFKQDCNTVCDGANSRKQWREKWAASDVRSPIPVIDKWLGRAQQRGEYTAQTVVPAERSDQLAAFTEPTYCFTWTETEIDWKSLCDAHPDTLFGGEELLSRFNKVELTMFIGTEDLLIDAILLEAEGEEQGWLSYTLIPSPAQAPPDVAYNGEIEQNVLLREEWEIVYSYITGDDVEQE